MIRRDGGAPLVEDLGGSAVVHVHVQPRAGKTEVVGRHGSALRIRVTKAPVDGRATEAARRALAEALGLSPARVRLQSGARSRLKRFVVDGASRTEVEALLANLVA